MNPDSPLWGTSGDSEPDGPSGARLIDLPNKGALVEIYEPVPTEAAVAAMPAIKPSRVRVNGTDVGLLLREGGIEVDLGRRDGCMVVTLRLIATRVEIKAATP